jgi:hypothetical protein
MCRFENIYNVGNTIVKIKLDNQAMIQNDKIRDK